MSATQTLQNPVRRGRRRVRVLDTVGFSILTAVGIVVGVAATFVNALTGMMYDGCTTADRCNFYVGAVSLYALPALAAVVLVVVLVWGLLRIARGRLAWWLPLAGSAATFGLFLASVAAVSASAHH